MLSCICAGGTKGSILGFLSSDIASSPEIEDLVWCFRKYGYQFMRSLKFAKIQNEKVELRGEIWSQIH